VLDSAAALVAIKSGKEAVKAIALGSGHSNMLVQKAGDAPSGAAAITRNRVTNVGRK
jgi:hypothetical protein